MLDLPSRITHVTVYRYSALIRREAEVSITEPTLVRLGGLPLTLRQDSVRLATDGGIIAMDARVAVDVASDATGRTTVEPESLRAARAKVTALEFQLKRIRRETSIWGNLAPRSRDPSSPLAAPAWGDVLDAQSSLRELATERDLTLHRELHETMLELSNAKETLLREQDSLRRASSDEPPSPLDLRTSVIVMLHPTESVGNSTSTLRVNYLVHGTRWTPTYVARLEKTDAALEMRAMIAQKTGEDWNGVEMVFSTANPATWMDLPELSSVRIGRKQPAPKRTGFRPAPTGADGLYADWDSAFRNSADAVSLGSMVTRSGVASHETVERAAMAMAPPPPPSAAPRMMMASLAAPSGAADDMVRSVSRSQPAKKARSAPLARSRQAVREEESLELSAPANLLDYGNLRLRGPDSYERGGLVADSQSRHIAVALAFGQAAELENLPLPPFARDVQQDSVDYAFPSLHTLDIPSNGNWNNVLVSTTPIPAAISHVCVPRMALEVFRVVELTNASDQPLLPGPLDVYDRGEFLLTVNLEFTPPRAITDVGLGVDPNVKVARNARFHEEVTGLLRGGLALFHNVELEVRNLGATPVELEIRERLPFVDDTSANADELEVVVDSFNPRWEAYLQPPTAPDYQVLRGGRRFNLALAAGATQKIDFSYHVKLAGKHELIDGNRREP